MLDTQEAKEATKAYASPAYLSPNLHTYWGTDT